MDHRRAGRFRPGVPHDTAIADPRSHMILWLPAALLLALDLWTKDWAFRTLRPDDAPEHLFGLVTFRRSMNPGALFGLGEGLVYVFVAASFVAMGFVLYVFTCSSRRQHALHVGLALILAGAMGNLHDRILIRADRIVFKPDAVGRDESLIGEVIGDPDADSVTLRPWRTHEEPVRYPRREIASIESLGVVRDFIRFEPVLFGRAIWPWVFNVADILLTVGVAILLVHFWRDRQQRQTRGATEAVSTADRGAR